MFLRRKRGNPVRRGEPCPRLGISARVHAEDFEEGRLLEEKIWWQWIG